jgi:DNA-binding CsgD family transcriptional regulator
VVGQLGRGRSKGTVALIGRRAELEVLHRFLDRIGDGGAAVGLVGPPGVGKTSLIEALALEASSRGIRVLAARPTESEARVAHAGLRDLLAQLGEDWDDDLPAPQARALRVAVADDEAEGPDVEANALALRAAVLGAIESAGARGPLLVVVDDLHWLDASTADLLGYTARRAQGPVGFAFTRRSPALAPTGPQDLGAPDVAFEVMGMDDDAVRDLVRHRAGRPLDRTEVDRVVSIAGGNAFVAVELASAPGLGADLPASLDALASARLAALDGPAIDVLRVASAAAAPTVDLLRAALPYRWAVDDALAAAEAAGLISLSGGTVQFAHPLLRHATYVTMPPGHRRAAHRLLATTARRPEERARHLALATVGTDPEVAAALDAAAAQAARRGAPAEAAEFLELAAHLDPDPSRSVARRVRTAGHRLAAGDTRGAAEVADAVVAEALPDDPPGRATLAQALAVRATIAQVDGDLLGAATRFEQVVELADDPQVRLLASLSLAFLLTNTGQLDAARALVDQVDRIELDAGGVSDPLRAALGATGVMVRYLSGDPIDWDRLDDALAAAVGDEAGSDAWAAIPTTSHPLLVASLLFHMAGRLDEAAATCEQLRSVLRDSGDEAGLALVDFWVAWIWGALGHLGDLEVMVLEAEARGRAFGSPGRLGAAHTVAATLAAWRGDDARCLESVDAALAALGPASPPAVWAIAAGGLLELGRGDHEAALARYGPLVEVARLMGLHQATAAWWTPELVEVLAALGRPEEARALLDPLDLDSFGVPSADTRAVALRCAGLVAAAEGDAEAGEVLLREALVAHGEGRSDLARARTELVLGTLLRRQGHRRDAAAVLEPALATFLSIGTAGWAARASEELDRLGLRPQTDGSLTPTELAVAHLVGDGLTNKQVGARLHASPKTVEAHLTRIYRKVGVRSRSELAAAVARDPDRFTSPT